MQTALGALLILAAGQIAAQSLAQRGRVASVPVTLACVRKAAVIADQAATLKAVISGVGFIRNTPKCPLTDAKS